MSIRISNDNLKYNINNNANIFFLFLKMPASQCNMSFPPTPPPLTSSVDTKSSLTIASYNLYGLNQGRQAVIALL